MKLLPITNINVPIFRSQEGFGETLSSELPSFLFHHDLLNGRTGIHEIMRNASQQLSKQETYSCAFCDSVSRKMADAKPCTDLESLYLEHMSNFHGLLK